MTEPIFQIVTQKRQNSQKVKCQNTNMYHTLFQEYLSRSYGYYTELFLKKICQNAQNQHEKLRKFQFRKILREAVQRYFLSDLQIIFLSYFANLHLWNFNHTVIEKAIEQNEVNIELNQINKFKLFLYLLCFFVKSYVGSQTQISALINFHKQNLPLFAQIYQYWIQHNPKQFFNISPRALNQIYTQHSRNCGQKSQKKDFNNMVDKILDLSTTYSIIPTKEKQIKQKKSLRASKQILLPSPQKRSMRIMESNLYQGSLHFDLSDWRSQKRESILIPGSNNTGSNNTGSNNVAQKGEKIQSKFQGQDKNINGSKKINLNKKKKTQKDQVNNVAKSFFRGKDVNISVDDIRKNQGSLRDIVPSSFLDLNMRSSKIESLPFQYRNNSNLFGPSTLF